ncbi:MAG: cyclase family protein [Candidatus Bathyarchaeia archaeon]
MEIRSFTVDVIEMLQFDRAKWRIIDLTLPIYPFHQDFVGFPKVCKWGHVEGARLNSVPAGVDPEDFPEGMGQAWEEATLTTHLGTHLDSPYHYYPTTAGKPAKTIDKVPLDWTVGDGVVLNLTHKKPRQFITKDDIIKALKKINYQLKQYDIVLIRTDWDKKWGKRTYFEDHPGMSAEATSYLLDQGIVNIGVDTFGFDRPFKAMGDDYKRTGDKRYLWPAHFVGKDREFIHYERLANLDKIPVPYGFIFVGAPVVIEGASAGWTRAFAIVEQEAT